MKIILQKVTSASVSIDNLIISEISNGYLLLLGIGKNSTAKDIDPLIEKILKLRLFESDGKFFQNPITQSNGEILVVSQFTIYADTKKGNRPSFSDAMNTTDAKVLYSEFVSRLSKVFSKVKEGQFGAYMQVSLTNDGPQTYILE